MKDQGSTQGIDGESGEVVEVFWVSMELDLTGAMASLSLMVSGRGPCEMRWREEPVPPVSWWSGSRAISRSVPGPLGALHSL